MGLPVAGRRPIFYASALAHARSAWLNRVRETDSPTLDALRGVIRSEAAPLAVGILVVGIGVALPGQVLRRADNYRQTARRPMPDLPGTAMMRTIPNSEIG
jgi:hypothetical protein